MSQPRTQQIIRNTFIDMLNQMPLHKITVKSLVAACDLNRNTFYYYYEDIYDIIHEIFDMELKKVFCTYNATLSWEESFLSAADFALQNKTALYHIYHSIQREAMEQYLFRLSGNVMTRYVAKIGEGINVSPRDRELITSFYQSALTEMVIRWIAGGMREDPRDVTYRIGQLFNGNILLSLKRSAALTEH